ncbi:hypothetical protein [Streptomonospora litoralis]|uniref:Uncharacterized protein n=1 Tax=Streptomonospora litoralis TaxID=2498135 RepID=A0A4P6Q7U8_9ACTN|nr:hypothetical protein [Streptomonospora litoralis]QBI56878.1 hypothetical protein EKD16_25690 [Streptomonospora litoralis]
MHEMPLWPYWLILAYLVALVVFLVGLGAVLAWGALASRYWVDRALRARLKRDATAQRGRAHEAIDKYAECRTQFERLRKAFDEAAPQAAHAALVQITAPDEGAS